MHDSPEMLCAPFISDEVPPEAIQHTAEDPMPDMGITPELFDGGEGSAGNKEITLGMPTIEDLVRLTDLRAHAEAHGFREFQVFSK